MSIDISRVKAILFDVDGTLRDTDDLWVARVSKLIGPAAFMLPRRDVASAARRVVMGIEDPGNLALYMADRLGLDDLAVRVAKRLARHPGAPASPPVTQPPSAANPTGGLPGSPSISDLPSAPLVVTPSSSPPPAVTPAPTVIPGVVDALTILSARFPLAVVSARPEGSTMRFLTGNNLTAFFRAIATGQTTRHTKPFPDPVIWAAQQLGVAPEACLMVGDTTPDMRAGRSAGAQALGVLCGFGDELELRAAGADDILPSTANLPELFL